MQEDTNFTEEQIEAMRLEADEIREQYMQAYRSRNFAGLSIKVNDGEADFELVRGEEKKMPGLYDNWPRTPEGNLILQEPEKKYQPHPERVKLNGADAYAAVREAHKRIVKTPKPEFDEPDTRKMSSIEKSAYVLNKIQNPGGK